MKKLTVLLTILIILSNIPICSFAFEATDIEQSAYSFASEFLNKCISNVYLKTEYDLSYNTLDSFDSAPQIKNEILEKAKEYEDEIRDNHRYYFYEDNKDLEPDENGVILPPGPDPDKRPVCNQYDNTAIEDVLSSFPVFIEKKISYMKTVNSGIYTPHYSLYERSPQSAAVSESGFAYVDYGDCHVLLYRHDTHESPNNDRWLVCDVSNYFDRYDEKYRFHSEDMNVDRVLLYEGYTLTTEDELSAYEFASSFLDRFRLNMSRKTEFDLSAYTIANLDDSQKNKILMKARKYEDEIRNKHRYHYYEDGAYIRETAETDEHGVGLPPEPESDKRPSAKQYDNTAIEDVISSFPTFIEKKCQYMKTANRSGIYTPDHSLYNHYPQSVTVSESGFAYLNYGSLCVLLCKYREPDEDKWAVCDVSIYYDLYDEEYRFRSEDMDVENELISKGYTPVSDSSDKSDNKVQDSPNENEPANYIPWIICGIEAPVIIALVIVLVLKKKKE